MFRERRLLLFFGDLSLSLSLSLSISLSLSLSIYIYIYMYTYISYIYIYTYIYIYNRERGGGRGSAGAEGPQDGAVGLGGLDHAHRVLEVELQVCLAIICYIMLYYTTL